MPVTGEGRREVLFVAEAPGKTEDIEGTQLIGDAGQYLRRVLRSLKFDLDEGGWKTNALICRPPKNRRPTMAEVEFCRPNVLRAIRDLGPHTVVLLGASAVDSVIGHLWKGDNRPLGTWVGWRIPCQELNVWLCPTWHPSFLLREDNPVFNKQFWNHLQQAIECDTRPWPAEPPNWTADVQRVFDPEKAAAWVQKIIAQQSGAVAFDYETNMLKPDGKDACILSCAVAWGHREPEQCVAFPWHGAVIGAMRELLRSPIPKIASNLKFEDRWTRKEFGHRVRGWAWDTVIGAHVADNRQGITGLKFQSFVRLGMPVWNDRVEQFLKTKGNETVNAAIREIELEDLLLYNGLDALLEFRVAISQMNELGFSIPWSCDEQN